jgi:hypothetical protein
MTTLKGLPKLQLPKLPKKHALSIRKLLSTKIASKMNKLKGV